MDDEKNLNETNPEDSTENEENNLNNENEENLDEENLDSSETEEKEETVPLAVYLKEKNKRKQLASELTSLQEKTYNFETMKFIEDTTNDLVQSGLDEEIAKKISSNLAKVMDSKNNNNKYENIFEDIKELASEDDFFADAETYKNEIAKKIIDNKKKGVNLSVEEAYFALRGKVRIKEMKNATDKKKSIQNKERETTTTTKNASGKAPTNKFALDSEEKKILAELQKAQPDAKWTAEKYYKMMKNN